MFLIASLLALDFRFGFLALFLSSFFNGRTDTVHLLMQMVHDQRKLLISWGRSFVIISFLVLYR